MKAVQVHSFGGPDVMSLEEMVLPEPGPFEARVKVEAIGVNFVDVYYRTGQYQRPLRLIPGMEAAGIVDVVGPKCAGPAPGTRVAYAMQLGSYAEYTIVPTDRLVVVPDE